MPARSTYIRTRGRKTLWEHTRARVYMHAQDAHSDKQVHAYRGTHVNTCTHIGTHIDAHTYTQAPTCTCVHITGTHMCTGTPPPHVHPYTPAHTSTHSHSWEWPTPWPLRAVALPACRKVAPRAPQSPGTAQGDDACGRSGSPRSCCHQPLTRNAPASMSHLNQKKRKLLETKK